MILRNKQGDEFIIVKDYNARNVVIRFLDFPCEVKVLRGNMVKGAVANPMKPSVYGVGYRGIGEYVSRKDGKSTLEYTAWHNMMLRCYDLNAHIKNPTYVGACVDEKWHNFQNFAEWYVKNPAYGRGWELDKDILVPNNKVYGPETCSMVPQEINALYTFHNKGRGEHPLGVSYHKTRKYYVATLNVYKQAKEIGRFKTPEEAFLAYKKHKEAYMKEVAEKWKSEISLDVYNAICNFNITVNL